MARKEGDMDNSHIRLEIEVPLIITRGHTIGDSGHRMDPEVPVDHHPMDLEEAGIPLRP